MSNNATPDSSEPIKDTEQDDRDQYELTEIEKGKLAMLQAKGVITHITCIEGTASINEAAWDYFDFETKKVLGKLIFNHCRNRDYIGNGGFKFLSNQTGHTLGGYHWYSDELYVK